MSSTLRELEADFLSHISEIDRIYTEMIEKDSNSLADYPLLYLSLCRGIASYVVSRIRQYIASEPNKELRNSTLFGCMAASLYADNLEVYNAIQHEKALIDTTSTALACEFHRIDSLVTLLDNEILSVYTHDQADLSVCRILIKGITDVVASRFAPMHPKPHIFLFNSKGASPSYPNLNCAFLMIGHYQGNAHEATIFQTSIVHELSHMERAKRMKVRPYKSQRGQLHFFDEGLATQNAYASISEGEKYFIKYHNSTCLIHRYSGLSIRSIMDNWTNYGDRPVFPAYDYACCCMNFLDKRYYPLTSKNFFQEWLAQNEHKSLIEYFGMYFPDDFSTMTAEWEAQLRDWATDTIFIPKSRIELVSYTADTATVKYASEDYLWYLTDVFCMDSCNRLLRLGPSNPPSYRFQKQGSFYVELDTYEVGRAETLTFFVLQINNVDVIKVNLS